MKFNTLSKDVEKSTLLRQNGNKIFAGPNPDQALDLYIKSILTAPVDSQELRLSYGNLSAVFFLMEKFMVKYIRFNLLLFFLLSIFIFVVLNHQY